MAPELEKPKDEKEAIADLTYAVRQLTNILVSIQQELHKLNKNQLKGPKD